MDLRRSVAVGLFALSLPAGAVDGYRVWHDGRMIDVVDRDGWAMYQDDIIIGRTAEVLRRSGIEGPDGVRIGGAAKSETLGNGDRRWPRGSSGLFEIPYVIETDPDNNAPTAVSLFNNSLSGFFLAVPRTNEGDYVAFTLSATDESGACASSVGRIGGRQIIQGSHLCAGGTLVHEMGHAIGLFHEQEHADAALFVQVNVANVDPSSAHNYIPSVNERPATPYDFGSIMHYGSTGFSAEGGTTLATLPPGIPIGQRSGYSASDLDGIRRFYGTPPQQVTVTTFPTGLTVIVDGVTTVAPATYNWSIGSSHTLDVPASAQVASGVTYVFGRWNIDRAGDMASHRTFVVAAGDGTMTAPTTRPAVTTYSANFVRYKQVNLTTSGNHTGVGGSVAATPQPISLPGLTGTYYRDQQDFTLDAVPGSGSLFGSWNGSYGFFPTKTTSYRLPFRGPVAFIDSLTSAYEYRAAFVDYPLLTVRARSQAGEVLGLKATVARTGVASSDERMPYNGVAWTSGQTGTLTAATTPQTPIIPTTRYTFTDWDGNPTATISVASPATGQASSTVTANYNKEYQAYKQVNPSCAGTITLPGNSTAWYGHGSTLPVSLSISPGWVLASWDGTLAGSTATDANVVVTALPNLVANLNTVTIPLTVTSVTPTTVASGTPTTIQITGTGFTPLTEVYVSGNREPSQYVSPTQLTATAVSSDFPSIGMAIVTVANRPASGGSCAVTALGRIDVFGATTAVSYEGLWLKSDESGWGVNVTHQGTTLFATWFTYDTDGTGMWLVASGVAQTSAGNFSGALYRTVGPAFSASPFTSIAFPANYTQVGTMSFSFTDANNGTMTYTVNGVSQSKAIQRFIYASSGTTCTLGGAQGASPNYQDLWLRSADGAQESGWGINITHQGDILFATWFTYLPGSGSTNKGLWVVMSNGAKISSGVYSGALQTTTGPAFSAVPFNPNAVTRTTVGTGTFTFTDANNGTFSYTVNGVSGTKPIARYIYATPSTVCQ